MRTVKLLPNNPKLKRRIETYGEVWEMISLHPQACMCFDGDLGVMIRSLNGKHFRWIRILDFKPIEITP